MNVLVTGASGFIGRHLCAHLEHAGHRVHTVGRGRPAGPCTAAPDFDWSEASLRRGVERCEAIVNLAGENLLARRWNARRKELLRASRVETTAQLARCLVLRGRGTLLSASAVGYYGTRGDGPLDERSPPGADFLALLCRDWESAARSAEGGERRVSCVRIGIVLGRDGGALARMLLLFRLGLGGPLGSGRQAFPWIHVDDLCAFFRFLLEHPECSGPFNGTAPEPVSQREFARCLGRVLRRPAVLPAPGFALRLFLGETAEVLLTGARALPSRAREAGFSFAHPELAGALGHLLA